jgi:hypothetical protein
MTVIQFHQKKRWREATVATREAGKIRSVCLALDPTAILFRRKGTRGVLTLPISVAYQMAAKIEANRLIAARKAMRAQRRKEKKDGLM